MNDILDAFIVGLDDYTMDERGDVGSWVRIACIQGTISIVQLLCQLFVLEQGNASVAELTQFLPPPKFHAIVAGVLKQGMERLDNVRQEAGVAILKLINLPSNKDQGSDVLKNWRLHGISLLRELFVESVQFPDRS